MFVARNISDRTTFNATKKKNMMERKGTGKPVVDAWSDDIILVRLCSSESHHSCSTVQTFRHVTVLMVLLAKQRDIHL